MKQLKLSRLVAALGVSGLLFFAATPLTFAHGGSDDVSGSSTPDHQKVDARILELRTAGQTKLAERRAGQEAKTAARRQQICENRKTSINNKITAFNNSANNILTRFNDVYARVKTFKTDKQLEVSNYDELIAAANAKQEAATEAVAALKDLSADFDCTATDPAQTVAAIKASTADAKTALKEYRTSIKNIVVALAQVNKTSDNSTTSDDSGNSTNAGDTTTTTNTTTEEQ